MCRQCGREVCDDCFNVIVQLTSEPVAFPQIRFVPEPYFETSGSAQDTFPKRRRTFLACIKSTEHSVTLFNPVTRFYAEDLEITIKEMGTILGKNAASDLRALIEFETIYSQAKDHTPSEGIAGEAFFARSSAITPKPNVASTEMGQCTTFRCLNAI